MTWELKSSIRAEGFSYTQKKAEMNTEERKVLFIITLPPKKMNTCSSYVRSVAANKKAI